MPGQGVVLLDFVELGVVDDGHGVLLAVHRLLLQGRVELAEVHRRGVRAQELEERDVHRVLHRPELEALHVGRRVDGLAAVRHVPEAVLEVPEVGEAEGCQVGIELLAQFAVKGLEGGLAALEQEGQVQDLEALVEAGDRRGRGQGDLDGPQLDGFRHLAIAAELRVRVELDLDLAVGVLLHVGLENILHADVVGVGLGHDRPDLDGVVGRHGGQGNREHQRCCKEDLYESTCLHLTVLLLDFDHHIPFRDPLPSSRLSIDHRLPLVRSRPFPLPPSPVFGPFTFASRGRFRCPRPLPRCRRPGWFRRDPPPSGPPSPHRPPPPRKPGPVPSPGR